MVVALAKPVSWEELSESYHSQGKLQKTLLAKVVWKVLP